MFKQHTTTFERGDVDIMEQLKWNQMTVAEIRSLYKRDHLKNIVKLKKVVLESK